MSLTSIVVVNWNTRETLGRCLESVRSHTRAPYELVLVDNGSTDGSVKFLEPLAGPRCQVILLPRNLGFAGGCNRGLIAARGQAVCLLNSDTRVTRGWLETMLRFMDRSGAGLIGPCTDHAKGRQRRKPWWGRVPPPFRRSREVESLSFFCVLIARPVLSAVGLLDERFGLGTYEDDDYCRRAREAGFRLFIAGRAWVWHEAHATFRANRLDDRQLQQRNREVFDQKWGEGGPPRP